MNLVDLTTVTDAEIQAEMYRRSSRRISEIGKDRYHPRRKVFEIAEQLERDKVHYKQKAVTIEGAKLWLDYQEYCNAPGGQVFHVMVEIDGETYCKHILEAHCLDMEVRTWLAFHKTNSCEVFTPTTRKP